jgi:hypothetical protein
VSSPSEFDLAIIRRLGGRCGACLARAQLRVVRVWWIEGTPWPNEPCFEPRRFFGKGIKRLHLVRCFQCPCSDLLTKEE